MVGLDEVWKKYAETYDYFYAESLKVLHRDIASYMSGDVCDLGAGTGKLLASLSDINSYVGVELSEAMFNIASEKYSNKFIKFINQDILSFSSDEMFDSVSMVNVLYALHSLENVDKLFSNVYKFLKPDGKFVFTNLNSSFTPEKLNEIISDELEKSIVDIQGRSMFDTFLKCNQELAGASHGEEYCPLLLTIEEIEKHLLSYGFKVDKFQQGVHFNGMCDLIVASKC